MHNQFDLSVDSYRNALRLKPDHDGASGNLLFTLQHLTSITPDEVFREHLSYAERFEAPLKPLWRPHANSTKRDAYTERIAAHMDHWLVCNTLSDDQLAERIRLDGIDILVDLSGHTAHHRLPVFARKPAPVQATYIGYPDTTGLASMDYRITDPWLDPPGLTERFHSETLVRIPGGMAYRPDAGAPEVNALPALTSGELMLASFNNQRKVNPAVVQLWARILHALPQARLMLGNVNDDTVRQRLLSLFSHHANAAHGCARDHPGGQQCQVSLRCFIDVARGPARVHHAQRRRVCAVRGKVCQ